MWKWDTSSVQAVRNRIVIHEKQRVTNDGVDDPFPSVPRLYTCSRWNMEHDRLCTDDRFRIELQFAPYDVRGRLPEIYRLREQIVIGVVIDLDRFRRL